MTHAPILRLFLEITTFVFDSLLQRYLVDDVLLRAQFHEEETFLNFVLGRFRNHLNYGLLRAFRNHVDLRDYTL